MATTYMGLTLPTVGSTAGPAWASQLNSALTLVDSHDHTSGKGTLIPTAGLNINADLPFSNYNATSLRTVQLYNQGSPLGLASDLTCLYASGGNLYYNNAGGTQIQITAGGALNAASIGGIGGDYATSTASVFYTDASKTFSFWQDSNQSASLDVGNIIVREPGVASANGITIKSPSSLSAAYSLTLLGSLPSSTQPVSISSTGTLSAAQLTSAQISDAAVTTAKINDLAVTTAKINDLAITSGKLASSSVTATKMAAASVSTANIVDASVTAAKIQSNAGIFYCGASYNSAGTVLKTIGQATLGNAVHGSTGVYQIVLINMTSTGIVIATPNQDTTSLNVRAVPGSNSITVYADADCSFSILVVKL